MSSWLAFCGSLRVSFRFNWDHTLLHNDSQDSTVPHPFLSSGWVGRIPRARRPLSCAEKGGGSWPGPRR